MPQNIKAVFFDLDETLVLTAEADEQAYLEVAALAKQLVPEVDADKLVEGWKLRFGEAPWDPEQKVHVEDWRASHWAAALRDQGFEQEGLGPRLQACFKRERLQKLMLEPGVKDLAKELRARGIATAIITNGHPEIQRGKLERCCVADLFDHIVVGGEEVAEGRHAKPHPSIFIKACTLTGCQPHEAVHIGDSLEADIRGGNSAGLAATIWVNRWEVPRQLHKPEPTFVVSHVRELTTVLEQIEKKG